MDQQAVFQSIRLSCSSAGQALLDFENPLVVLCMEQAMNRGAACR